MKIAIHWQGNGFNIEWRKYCEDNEIPYKLVNCYDSDIIDKIEDCEILMWHHNHANPKDVLFAKQLLVSLEIAGKVVFPDFFSTWHFDDKLGQKYLFEALNIPHVPTVVFFEKEAALNWSKRTTFPKVFKIRRGAGSGNVWLVKNKNQAVNFINRAFGSGIRQYDAFGATKDQLRKLRLGMTNFKELLKAILHIYFPIKLEKSQGNEAGYVYFQDFIPNNEFDIRVVVVGDKAFAIKRWVRENDFRASGSGIIEYDKINFDNEIIQQSFINAKKMQSYCSAFDYVYLNEKALLVEVSYGFNKLGYLKCPGYWNQKLEWVEGEFNPYGWMIEDSIKKLVINKKLF